jgi:hypothetical protein
MATYTDTVLTVGGEVSQRRIVRSDITYLFSRGQGKVRVQDMCRMYIIIQAKFAQHPPTPTPSLECTRAEACSPVPSLFSSPDAWDSTHPSRHGSFH